MKDCREEWYDPDRKVAVTFVDVTSAAQDLARGHLCGPTSAYFLAKAFAADALLGAETSEKDETVAIQMKCKGLWAVSTSNVRSREPFAATPRRRCWTTSTECGSPTRGRLLAKGGCR